jgi:hypothetical protein
MNWPVFVNGLKDFLLVGGLVWGIKLLKQQNELLTAEKSLKQSEIDLHKANIEHLRSLQAPSIASDLEQMTRTAERYAEEKQKLEEQVKALGAESRAAALNLVNQFYLLGVTKASLAANSLFERLWANANFTSPSRMVSEIDDINQRIRRMGEEALDGKFPEESDGPLEQVYKALEEARARKIGPPTKQEGTPSESEPDPDPDF